MTTQPWIYKPKIDSLFIIFPTFFALLMVVIFNDWLLKIQEEYSFYTWLFLIVFIDVAHVYATLFKTYFVPLEFQKRKKLLIILPIICFLIGLVLYSFGSAVFWSVLAYVAVFHFVRQQYGFVRLYARKEEKTFWNRTTDALIIYTATVYPMIFWFLSPKRNFNWFTENDFLTYQNPKLLQIVTFLYFLSIGFYITRTLYFFLKTNYFNIPKNLIIIGTLLSWYFGIVFYNNDLIFTILNVVSHGIPYIALIYLNEIKLKTKEVIGKIKVLHSGKGIIVFITILLLIAFTEEYLWEILVWNENFSFNFNTVDWHFLLVPLLTVPQFTHYLLDGFIWKSRK